MMAAAHFERSKITPAARERLQRKTRREELAGQTVDIPECDKV